MRTRTKLLSLLIVLPLCLTSALAAMASGEPEEAAPPSFEEAVSEASEEPEQTGELSETEKSASEEDPMPAYAPALDGASNEEICFRFLKDTMGLGTAAACGILANIYCESGFDPNVTGDRSSSYGICQWHDWGADTGRFTNLKNFCAENGYDYHTLEGQLYFLQYELTENRYGLRYILTGMLTFPDTAQGAYDAGYYWCQEFGRPAYPDVECPRRGELARDTYFPKYAETAIISCTVSFDADGGIPVGSRTVTAGSPIGTLPDTTKAGYAFSGWYTQKNSGGAKLTEDTLATSDMTCYAGWTALSRYTVTYDANGGSGTPMPQTKTQGTGLIITSTIPRRTGYTFLGWSESPAARQADYAAGSTYHHDGSITLYAVWQYNYRPGDMDGDGVYTAGDAARVLALIGTNSPGADTDGNGSVTAYDAVLLLRSAVAEGGLSL